MEPLACWCLRANIYLQLRLLEKQKENATTSDVQLTASLSIDIRRLHVAAVWPSNARRIARVVDNAIFAC